MYYVPQKRNDNINGYNSDIIIIVIVFERVNCSLIIQESHLVYWG